MSKSKGAPQRADTVPIRYTIHDIERLRKEYKAGQQIRIAKKNEDGEERERSVKRIVTVDAIYPYHVSCIDAYGQRESFGYFELEAIAR